VPEDSRFRGLLHANTSAICQELVIQERITTAAPYITLPTTFDEYFRSLSPKRRKRLRRASRSLEKAHNVEFKQFDADSLEEGLNKFIDLHQRRWQSVNIRGMFTTSNMREFYRDIASQFLKRNWLHFSCLAVDNEMTSGEYGFVYNDKLYELTAARNIRYAEYSTGHLHALYLIKEAISNSLREIDLLKGEEPYKFHWTKSTRKYVEITVVKKGHFPCLRIELLRAFLRLYQVRQYNLREIYSLYFIKRREREEKKRMGLDK
jgi:CelD/BcsL family acetyltransferase involved in cellulose biosynthesis